MKSTGINERHSIDIDSWLRATFVSLRTKITLPNLVGLVGGLLAVFLLLVLHEPWNIRIPLYVTILIWTILRPPVALYLMAFAVPWGSLDYIDVGGLRLNNADLLVAFLAIGRLLSFALRRTAPTVGTINRADTPRADKSAVGTINRPLRHFVKVHNRAPTFYAGPPDQGASGVPGYLVLAIMALLTAMLLSMTVAVNIAASLKEISKWLEFLVLLLLGAQYVHTRRQLWTIIILVCLAGITQAIFGYLQAFFDLGPASFVRDTSLRIYGTFDQPNPYAGYINMPLSIAVALMLLGSNWKTRILAGLTAALLAAAEYLTQSRGGEIAIAAALFFIVAVSTPRLSITIRLLVLAGLAAVEAFLVGLIPAYLFNPVLRSLGLIDVVLAAPTKQNFSTAERLAHWIAGLRMFITHPILGVGIGNYPDAYPHYFVTIFMDPLGHAHNYYINIAAETGSIGLIAYLLFLLAIFVAGARSYRYINKKLASSVGALSGACCRGTLSGGQVSPCGYPFNSFAPRGEVGLSPRHISGIRPDLSPPGQPPTVSKLLSLIRSLSVSQYAQQQDSRAITSMLTNDRALAIGLLAALISVCVHNIFDDLYVHSLTNLIALLLIALIRLEEVASKVGVNGG